MRKQRLRRRYEAADLPGAVPRSRTEVDGKPDVAEMDQRLGALRITMTDCETSGSGSGVAVHVNGHASLGVDGFTTNDRVAFSGTGEGQLRVRRLRHAPERRT